MFLFTASVIRFGFNTIQIRKVTINHNLPTANYKDFALNENWSYKFFSHNTIVQPNE